jgi:tight adherence protein C
VSIVLSPVLVAACGAASAFSFGLSLVPSENPLVARIGRLEGITERSVSKHRERIESIVGEERRSKLQDRLSSAGWYSVSPGALTLRGIAGFAGGAAIGLICLLVMPNKEVALAIAVLAAFVGMRVPKIAVDRAIKARRREVSRSLPDFLDLLASTVQAGLALNGALVYATEAQAGALREELGSALAEIRLGRARADALKSMADRVGERQLRSMVTSIVQAERLGANLSHVLRELALEVRNERWLRAEENAAKLPVKMVFPMALLMLPSLYVMIFGPVVANMLSK